MRVAAAEGAAPVHCRGAGQAEHRCPTFRSKGDAELTKKMYRNASVLVSERTDSNPWEIELKQGHFNLTSDSDLFWDSDELIEEKDAGMEGNCLKSENKLYLPLYEAKMIHQADHRYATYDDGEIREATQDEHRSPVWLPSSRHWVERGKLPFESNWYLSFRDIARTTDVRTGIFSVTPAVAFGNSAPVILSSRSATESSVLLANCNSTPFDFIVRQKLGGTHLNFYILKQLPVRRPERYTPELLGCIVPRILELTYTAWDLTAFSDDIWNEASEDLRAAIKSQWQSNVDATGGGHSGEQPPKWVERSDQADEEFPHPPFMWDGERRRFLRAELDALYGHLYGLSHDELDYILETFPIVKDQDIEEFGDYRTKKLILHCFDQLEEAIEQGKAYDPILDLPAIELGDIRPESESEGAETVDEPMHASTPSA